MHCLCYQKILFGSIVAAHMKGASEKKGTDGWKWEAQIPSIKLGCRITVSDACMRAAFIDNTLYCSLVLTNNALSWHKTPKVYLVLFGIAPANVIVIVLLFRPSTDVSAMNDPDDDDNNETMRAMYCMLFSNAFQFGYRVRAEKVESVKYSYKFHSNIFSLWT